MFSKFIWVILIQKQQKYIFLYFIIMIWNITVRYKFWRTYLFQDAQYASSVIYFVKDHMKSMLHWQMCGLISLKFELSESILKQLIKEELHNRLNLISEERVKKFKHNSENLMKIGWKIRKLWHFEVSQIFKKHFLTSRYEYANEWGDDVIASQFSIHFVHRNDKNFIFLLWEC